MKFNKFYCYEYKDQFNYYNLIKKINPSFRLYFNTKSKKFLIININNNYEICKTFSSFYEDILNDLRFSTINNFESIIEFIDESNQRLLKKNKDIIQNKIHNSISEFNKIHHRSNKINQSDINKIIGETTC